MFRILAENVLHKGLKVNLENLIVGKNTRQLSTVGVNKIKDMIKQVGWVPHKGILYVMPEEDFAARCEQSFLKYDFSKDVAKVCVLHLEPKEKKCVVNCSYYVVLGDFQILDRDGTDIVPKEFERYVDNEAVNFIENECKWTVFEGIHRTVVSE